MTNPRYADPMSKPHHLSYTDRFGGYAVWCDDCEMPERWFPTEAAVFDYVMHHSGDSADLDLMRVTVYGGPDDGAVLWVPPMTESLQWNEYDEGEEAVMTYRTTLYVKDGRLIANYAYRQEVAAP